MIFAEIGILGLIKSCEALEGLSPVIGVKRDLIGHFYEHRFLAGVIRYNFLFQRFEATFIIFYTHFLRLFLKLVDLNLQ